MGDNAAVRTAGSMSAAPGSFGGGAVKPILINKIVFKKMLVTGSCSLPFNGNRVCIFSLTFGGGAVGIKGAGGGPPDTRHAPVAVGHVNTPLRVQERVS